MKFSRILIPFFLSCVMLAGCKVQYSFTGASIAPDVKTVSVQYFDNRAPLATPTLSQEFTEDLKDIFLSRTNLTLVEKSGDLQFEGEITDYRTAPTAIQGNETAAVNRLTITVNVRFLNNKEPEQNFEKKFTKFADYESSQNLAAIEDELIEEVNEQLVQEIFNQSVSNW